MQEDVTRFVDMCRWNFQVKAQYPRQIILPTMSLRPWIITLLIYATHLIILPIISLKICILYNLAFELF